VALVGRDEARGARAAGLVARDGTVAGFFAGDAGDAEGSTRLACAAADFLGGRVDVFASAVAPGGHVGPALEQDAEELKRVFLGLALPVIQMNRAVLPFMTDWGGTIINIASDAAKVPTPGEAVVGGAMAAITMFSRTLALEVKRYGIRVHAVTPSLIADTATAERLMADEFGAKVFGRIADRAQLGVPIADDVAAAVLWLAGPSAAKMTGQVISVNGGTSAG
jgi:NAD(P)-dependent dehydrogenase (short-subunit alcohol dehydrogenase family)